MNGKPAAVLLSGLLVACVQMQPPEATTPPAPPPPPAQAQAPPAPAPAPADHIVNIRRARCEDLLKLSPEDRAAASMFYIGYQASRLRVSTINVGLISSIEGQAIADCEENPDRTVAQAFADAYLQTRRR
jgi:HdeA/HdeB family